MNILVVDDEKLILEDTVRVLAEVFNQAKICPFDDAQNALEYASTLKKQGGRFLYAFLDVQIGYITGIELGKRLKELFPQIRIIYITGYTQYAFDAYQLFAKAYLLKPITREALIEALNSMGVPWNEEMIIPKGQSARVRIQTFGNFEVFVGEQLLYFQRRKAKELLAYLVDRKGAGITTAEAGAVLFEDQEYGIKLTNNIQQVIHSMMKTLREHDVEDIIIKKRNYMALDVNKVSCDFYGFLEMDPTAVNSYCGEYMSNYSWAETTLAELENREKL